MLKVRCSHVEPDYAQINLPGVADGIAFVERRNIRTSLDLSSGEEHRADRWFVYWLGSPELEDDRVFRAPSVNAPDSAPCWTPCNGSTNVWPKRCQRPKRS